VVLVEVLLRLRCGDELPRNGDRPRRNDDVIPIATHDGFVLGDGIDRGGVSLVVPDDGDDDDVTDDVGTDIGQWEDGRSMVSCVWVRLLEFPAWLPVETRLTSSLLLLVVVEFLLSSLIEAFPNRLMTSSLSSCPRFKV
jgi:hypothetical protein